MRFKARTSSRSSTNSLGPPGEAEIIRLNPQRRQMILARTGWPDLVEGTLNLEVDPSIVIELGAREPYIREQGESVVYPEKYKQIPKKRRAYLYFNAIVRYGGKAEKALIRTAEVPLKQRLEAFAPVKLRVILGIHGEAEVDCEIVE